MIDIYYLNIKKKLKVKQIKCVSICTSYKYNINFYNSYKYKAYEAINC